MAEMLRVSGIPVPLLVDGAEETPRQIGEDETAEDGTILINRRAVKMDYSVKIAHQSPNDGIAFRNLMLGLGETWNFESSLYGSKGSKPTAAASAAVDATPKYGTNSCRLSATTGTISFAPLPANVAKWTVMVWRKVAAGAWVHYMTTGTLKAAGDAYVDGVLNPAEPTSWLTVTTATGTVKLDADAVSNTYIDDLVVLPYEIPATWPAAHVAYGAAFSLLAKLTVDGDMIEANVGSKTVAGSVGRTKFMPGFLNGVYYQSIRATEVELREG